MAVSDEHLAIFAHLDEVSFPSNPSNRLFIITAVYAANKTFNRRMSQGSTDNPLISIDSLFKNHHVGCDVNSILNNSR